MDAAEHKYLIFLLRGKRFAFDLAQVAEVIDPPVFWPIPRAPECYTGAINVHGAIVAVIDLASFMGLPRVPEYEKVIVLNAQVASLGFLVERVVRIAAEHDVVRVEPGSGLYTSQLLQLPEGEVELLDVSVLVSGAETRLNL